MPNAAFLLQSVALGVLLFDIESKPNVFFIITVGYVWYTGIHIGYKPNVFVSIGVGCSLNTGIQYKL